MESFDTATKSRIDSHGRANDATPTRQPSRAWRLPEAGCAAHIAIFSTLSSHVDVKTSVRDVPSPAAAANGAKCWRVDQQPKEALVGPPNSVSIRRSFPWTAASILL